MKHSAFSLFFAGWLSSKIGFKIIQALSRFIEEPALDKLYHPRFDIDAKLQRRSIMSRIASIRLDT